MCYLKVNSGGVKNYKLKRILHFLFILIIYSILITGSTYAYLYLEDQNNSISGTGKCEGVNYKGENISASNLVSTTNYLEGAKSTITLSKNKDCTIYTYVNLYLYTNNTTTAPITTVKALKYKIVSSNNVTYSGVVSYMGDTLLATLPLEDTEITYTIYLYIDSTVSLGNYNDKTYSGYIYATTEQTSTVGKEEDNSKKNLGLQTIDFDYLGSEQQFIVPETGIYQLETWGASGGGNTTYAGGYGGYSIANISRIANNILFINVGGKGKYCVGSQCTENGGYNGGGKCTSYSNSDSSCGSGGGATHIALKSGKLSTLTSEISLITIVSGGGGGGNLCNTCCNYAAGGHGGGYKGVSSINIGAPHFEGNGGTSAIGGTQSSGYQFGVGEGSTSNILVGAGGGFYGGKSSGINGAGGGSGYIGNSQLTDKVMYCYNCEESTEESTKTISTTNVSETPISKYAKIGNGYARITIT